LLVALRWVDRAKRCATQWDGAVRSTPAVNLDRCADCAADSEHRCGAVHYDWL